MNTIKKLCAIFDINTKIYQHTQTLHFDLDGKLLDFIDGCDYIESNFSPLGGLWKYNGTDFVEIIQGVFYKKTDASEESTIEVANENEYTQIPPLQKYNDGTTQAFNNVLGIWEYTFKGADLLAYEKEIELQTAKNQKFAELESAFANSKRIVIKEKNIEFPIRSEKRDIFFTILEFAKKTDNNQTSTETYFDYDIEESKKYEITCVPIILKKVYEMYFGVQRNTGFDERTRVRNYDKYNGFLKKINNAKTLEALDFQFDFINPNGIDVIFEDVANNLLNDASISAEIKQLVQYAIDNGFIQITDV